MEINKFPMLIVGVVVALVLAGAVLPVFAETTSATDTFKNEGLFYATPINEDSDYIISWDYTAPTSLMINDMVFDLSTFTSEYLGMTFLFTNDWMLRYQKDSSAVMLIKVNEVSSTIDTASVSTEKSLNVTIADGDADITIGTTTYNYTVASDGLIITDDTTAKYVMKTGTSKAYVLNDSVFYGAGRTGRPFGSGTALSTMAEGTIDDGMIIEISPSSYSVDSSAINSTKVSSYKGLYELSDFSFVLNNGADTTTTMTYNQIFVPSEVKAEKAVHPDGALTAILNILPILVIAGLVTGAVTWFVICKK